MIVGLDPGFAAMGVVIARTPQGISDVVFERVGFVKTARDRDLSAGQDLIARGDALATALCYLVELRSKESNVFALCVEGFSRPPNVGSAIKLGASHGVIAALVSRWRPEVTYVEQPQHIRKRVLGVGKGKTPSEESVHLYLLERYPELAALVENENKGARPHILDAAACVVAAHRDGWLA